MDSVKKLCFKDDSREVEIQVNHKTGEVNLVELLDDDTPQIITTTTTEILTLAMYIMKTEANYKKGCYRQAI